MQNYISEKLYSNLEDINHTNGIYLTCRIFGQEDWFRGNKWESAPFLTEKNGSCFGISVGAAGIPCQCNNMAYKERK